MGLQSIAKRILNIPGFKTNKKIVTFTVDDYGAIRMPSKEVYSNLEKEGVKFGDCRYSKYDALESNTDLEELFNILLSKKDFKGNHPVFTPVTITSNPDFNKIKKDNFQNYYHETFVETAKRYDDHDKIYKLYKKGIDLNIFVPELHNREHLDTISWLEDIKNGNPILNLAFKYQMYSINSKHSKQVSRNYQIALSFQEKEINVNKQEKALEDGVKIFKALFGYDSIHFTPPNSKISYQHFKTLSRLGIKLIDVGRINIEPLQKNKHKRHIHFLGQKSRYNQKFLVRNCIFELNSHINDPVSNCLSMISTAFKSGQPAIISSHRVNFSGYLYPENRELGLKELNRLLNEIQKRWPEVEFMAMRDLSKLMM